jgi:hypothetical protein
VDQILSSTLQEKQTVRGEIIMKKIFAATVASLVCATPAFAHNITMEHEHFELIAFGALVAAGIIISVLRSKKQSND